MHLSSFALAALTQFRKLASGNTSRDFDAKAAVTAVLNPDDQPPLEGLSYKKAMTDKAIYTALNRCHERTGDESIGGPFWFLVSTACTFATNLPLQKEQVDAAADFLDSIF